MVCGSPEQYGISLQDEGVYSDPLVQYGIGGFDNIFQAMLAVFQILTVEQWSSIMYNVSLAQ